MADYPEERYTNLTPTTATVGGVVAGTTFDQDTWQQVFDMLFYPYQYPAFTSFQFGVPGYANPLEVGDTILAGAQTFTFADTNPVNIQPNTIRIDDITNALNLAILQPNVSPIACVLPGPAYPLTHAGGSPTDSTNVYRIQGTNTLAGLFTRNFVQHWWWRYYYGPSANPGPLVSANITALATQGLSTAFAGNDAFVAGMTYKYITYPTVWGLATTFKDSLTLLDVPMLPVYVVAVTNGFGVVQNYNVHRTWNIINAAITIIVS